MLSLKKSITPADFFVDFSKVYLNIKDYERHLNLCLFFLSAFLAQSIVSVEWVNALQLIFGGGFNFLQVMLFIILNPSSSNAIPIE